jgi:hypothetical protein
MIATIVAAVALFAVSVAELIFLCYLVIKSKV